MRNKPDALLGSVLWLFSVAASANAQPPSGHHTITGFAGAHLLDLAGVYEDEGTEFQTELGFGGRYQYNLNDRVGIEWNVLFSPGTAVVRDDGGRTVGVTSSYYTLGIVYNLLTDARVVPYVTGGMGAATVDVSDGGTSDSSFTASFGGGLLFPLANRIAIRLDVRDFISNTGHLAPPSLEVLGLPSDFKKILHDLSVTAGLSIYF